MDDRRERPGVGLLVGGGITTAVGGALMIAGLAFAGRWASEADAYTALGEQERRDPGSVSSDEEAAQHRAWTSARATSLGLAIPGVVLLGVGVALLVSGARRRAAHERVAISHRGLEVRF